MVNYMPKISVIIPIYNAEKYLVQCLDSVTLQIYDNLEIICVNDGSTDNSLRILNNYANVDKRIKIVSQENKGLSAARNTGMKHATGDYISFVDSDDFITLGLYYKFAKIVRAEKRQIDIFLFNGLLNYEYNTPSESCLCALYDPKDWTVVTKSPFKKFSEHKSPAVKTWAAWNKIYRKKWLDEYNFRFPDGFIFEDRYFSAQTFLETENVYVYEDFLYFYRQHLSSLTQTMNENIFDIYKMVDEVERIYRKHNFLEAKKYSFFDYILHEITIGIPICRDDLLEQYIAEGKKRINNFLPLLDESVLPSLSYYGIYRDLSELTLDELKEKYKRL